MQNAEKVTVWRTAGNWRLAMNSYRPSTHCAIASLVCSILLLAGAAHADVPDELPSISITETKGCSVASGTQIGAGLVLVVLFGLSFAGRRRED
jgi:MYXO-CTERM domain-containing protein